MDNQKEVKKTYTVFDSSAVNKQKCSLKGLKIDGNKLSFTEISFESGLLSFEKDYIQCSIGQNLLKGFEIDETTIEYSKINEFEFIDCIFKSETTFTRGFASLEFIDCIFENKCYINNQYGGNTSQIEIDKLIIKDTVFNKNFKLHHAKVKYIDLRDSDFFKNADFFKSSFEQGYKNKINFHTINFNELALFGETEFYQQLEFKYVTFKGYSHFRSATFHQGLNLEYANIEQEMNFFNIQGLDNSQSIENTSQETYRIIKFQLQKVGNIIDSNKYHSLELSKHRVKLLLSDKEMSFFQFQRASVALLHYLSSIHSTSWILILFWLLIVGLVTNYSIYHVVELDKTIEYMSIFTTNVNENFANNHIIFLLNKISLGYLYYQFLTTIRMDTRK